METDNSEAIPDSIADAIPPLSTDTPGEVSFEGLGYVDGILRNREDYFASIFDDEKIYKHIGRLLLIIVALCFFHGLIMGTSQGYQQMIASAIKVPLLYLLTLVVCYPVLYVVNVVMGSQLSFLQTFTLILLAIALNALLLASCSPIVLFFFFTGADYDFLKLLHVVIFGFSGVWAMRGLWMGLVSMCESSSLYPKQAVRILQVWILVFAFVGTQTAWSLRPFIGKPDLPFEIVRKDQVGNFYQGVWSSIARLSGLSRDENRGPAPVEEPAERTWSGEVKNTGEENE